MPSIRIIHRTSSSVLLLSIDCLSGERCYCLNVSSVMSVPVRRIATVRITVHFQYKISSVKMCLQHLMDAYVVCRLHMIRDKYYGITWKISCAGWRSCYRTDSATQPHCYCNALVTFHSALNVFIYYWATVCKTVCPMLSDHCLSCPVCLFVLSVCVVGVLWPNSWMDQDETWRADRRRPWPHCVRWGPSFPSPKKGTAPNFPLISIVTKWLDASRCHLVWR